MGSYEGNKFWLLNPTSTHLFLTPTWPIYVNDLRISSAWQLVEHTHRWVYRSDPRRFGFKPYCKGNCWYGEWLPRKKGKVRESFLSLVTSETKTELSSYLVTKPWLFGMEFLTGLVSIRGEYYSLCFRLRLYLWLFLFYFLFPQIAELQMLSNARFVGILWRPGGAWKIMSAVNMRPFLSLEIEDTLLPLT